MTFFVFRRMIMFMTVRIGVSVRVGVSDRPNWVNVRMGDRNSACHIYLSDPDATLGRCLWSVM